MDELVRLETAKTIVCRTREQLGQRDWKETRHG